MTQRVCFSLMCGLVHGPKYYKSDMMRYVCSLFMFYFLFFSIALFVVGVICTLVDIITVILISYIFVRYIKCLNMYSMLCVKFKLEWWKHVVTKGCGWDNESQFHRLIAPHVWGVLSLKKFFSVYHVCSTKTTHFLHTCSVSDHHRTLCAVFLRLTNMKIQTYNNYSCLGHDKSMFTCSLMQLYIYGQQIY